MISPGSLSAFNAGAAASGPTRAPASASAGPPGTVRRARVQASGAAGTVQPAPKPPQVSPDKPLPRGSLLNLRV